MIDANLGMVKIWVNSYSLLLLAVPNKLINSCSNVNLSKEVHYICTSFSVLSASTFDIGFVTLVSSRPF